MNYKLAYYSESTNLLQVVYPDIKSPFIKGSSLNFDGGEMSGLSEYHILLEEEVVPPNNWGDAILLDKKTILNKHTTLEEENADLKKRLDDTQKLLEETNLLLLDFMETILV